MTTDIQNTPEANQFIIPAEVEEAAKAAESEFQKTQPEIDPEAEKTPEETAAAKAVAKEAYKRRKAERETGAASDRIAELESQVREMSANQATKTAATEAPKRPDPSKYELGRWDAKYEEDLSTWLDNREVHILAQAEAKAEAATRSLTENASRYQELHSLQETATKVGERGVDKYSDFEEIVQDALEAMPPAPEALKELVRLPNAEDVFYHLAQNPDELDKITDMSPMGQALEFGKISARLAGKAKSAGSVTKSKPSIQQPRGSTGQFSSESDSNYDKLLNATRNPWK